MKNYINIIVISLAIGLIGCAELRAQGGPGGDPQGACRNQETAPAETEGEADK